MRNHNLTFLSILGALGLAASAGRAAEVVAVFNTPSDVPVTAAGYVAAGNTVAITLNHAPAFGANLTVVDNTGAAAIQGEFGNLPDGGRISLVHSGISYGFVANYHGGTGNDLVLQWDNSRLMSWGYNGDGQLGHGRDLDSAIMVPAPAAPAVFAGKTVIAAAAGGYVGLASCSDGTLAAWGRSDQTGSSGPQEEGIPYLVDTSGALAGKKVVGLSAGFAHVLALCSDGSMATWGNNPAYEFGSGVPEKFPLPTAIPATGALAGKTVTAIVSGTFHNLVLCSDGTVAGWGRNGSGQLGNGSNNSATVPVAVNTSGVLNGKTVISIATGRDHALALCSDGTLAAWGGNGSGQLGNDSTTSSNLPVAVSRAGLLAGKTITAISAGANHSMALCSDGTLATWGDNGSGQLGNNSTTASRVPVAVIRTGALAGRTVTGIAGGQNHSLACCSDGTAVAFGSNSQFQLGTTTSGSRSLVPVLVGRNTLRAGERFVRMISGPLSSSSFALTGSAPLPVATPLDATLIADNAATLNGTVNANGGSTSVTFEYGTSPSFGTSVSATPSSASGASDTAVSRRITGLLPGVTYHYRIVCTGAAGTVASPGKTFTTTSQAALASLTLSDGRLDPAFAGNVFKYNSTVPFEVSSITVTPVVSTPGATVRVNGVPVPSGSASGSIALAVGNNTVTTVGTSPDGATSMTYTVTVIRLPQTFEFASATTIPLTADGFFADGEAPPVRLLFNPPAGTSVMVVRNTGVLPISGSFTNLTHGRTVDVEYGGTLYRFVVNYFGGNGNDLVLQWANTQLLAWGSNTDGQLGDGTRVLKRLPVPVDNSGPLAGRSVIALSAGISHSLALCSDGKMLAWGSGSSGTLGTGGFVVSSTPVEVDTTGVLAGKTVSSISAGFNFNHALCSDGTLVAWGDNRYGQIGDGTEDVNRFGPVAVDTSGVLAGKRVIAVSGGSSYALALCSDGTVVSWGANFYGELGVTPQKSYRSPVAVDRTGVLAGKTVVAISAGGFHALALCSDGTLASWGWNDAGQLGNNSTTNSLVPVAVNRSGVLAGKTIIEISASDNHSMVLCSDGTLAAWGANFAGQLGDNSTTNRRVPVAVNRSGLLAGKTVTRIATARNHSLALCSDGTLAAWGSNSDGQLGTGTTASSPVPVAVNKSSFGTGTRFVAGNTGPPASHSLALLALPMAGATTLGATSITGTSATLRGEISANGSTTNVSFEYGPTESYGMTVPGIPASFGPSANGGVTATIQRLSPGTTYYFRIRAESASGITFGSRMSFTTLSDNTYLQNLRPSQTTMAPAFDKTITDYITTLPFTKDVLGVIAASEDLQATVTIGGIAAGQGGGRVSLKVPVGNTGIPVVVTAEDGVTQRSYLLVATRLPGVFTFNSAADVPVAAQGFVATGQTATFALNFHPAPGTRLTVVDNHGLDFIVGTFDNLAQGQELILTYQGTGYRFVADYFGGTGNDLVLHWADNTAFAWGSNSYGQLGTGSIDPVSAAPVEIAQGGLLKGKTILALSTGYLHSLALCSDGSLAAWGYNIYGQLGNGGRTTSAVPLAVDPSGALAGRTVVAVSAGPYHNLALCADGGIVAWGYNNYGQLGDGTTANSPVPVSVPRVGALAGKTAIAVAAGAYHSFALCSDGTVAAWGYNDEGELGNGGNTGSLQPVAAGGVLAGKRVASIAAGQYHAIALCTDGTVAAWGYNHRGQLGTGGTTASPLPVPITASGALAGRVVKAVSASGSHSLALCADGTVAAWGLNSNGQLGDGTTTNRQRPVIVDQSGILAGKTVTTISAGMEHSLATCADGTLAAWGSNRDGRLGHPGPASSSVPVGVATASFPAGAIPPLGLTGSASSHGLAIVALPQGAVAAAALTEASARALVPPGLETWRLTNFGNPAGEGDASDLADPDHDGIVNLVEYAFALDPKQPSAGQLPQWQRIGDELVIRFTEPPGVTGITYGAKTSIALEGADWHPIEDTGTAPEHVFRVPIDRVSRFVRLEITAGKAD